MSAYLVNAALIDALLTYAGRKANLESPLLLIVPGELTTDGAEMRLDFTDKEICTDVGRILLEANADSLAARYGADDEGTLEAYRAAELYGFKRFTGKLEHGAVIAAVACLEYQSCEHDGYAMSLAQWIARAIANAAAFRMLTQAQRDAGWGLRVNPARGDEAAQVWSALLPETPETPEEPATSPRGALLAKLSAEPGAALPDAPEPAQEPETAPGPKPEPEVAAKKAAAKPKAKAKGKTRRKGKNKSAGKTASPPAAGASKRKATAPLAA